MPKRKTRRRIAYACTSMLGLLVLKVLFDTDLTDSESLAVGALSVPLMGIIGAFITGEHFSDKAHKND